MVITLDGTVQRLSTVLGGTPKLLRWLSLQADPANTHPVYLDTADGAGASLSDTNYGNVLPTPTGGAIPPPHIIGEFTDGGVSLGDIYVLGTLNEKLHVMMLAKPAGKMP